MCFAFRYCQTRLQGSGMGLHTFPSVKALMTIPSADNDLLIFLASSKVWPEAPVFPTFSEPARSTRYRFPVLMAPVSVFRCWIEIKKMECDREDSAFMSGQGESGYAHSRVRDLPTCCCYHPSVGSGSHDFVDFLCTAHVVIG